MMSQKIWQKRLVAQCDLMSLGDTLREKGKKIVFTAGNWDLLHPGQTRYLEKAKSYGDVLVVGIVSNEAIRRVKGPNKPVLDEMIRAEMLTYLRSVDLVTIVLESSANSVLGLLKPDVFVTVKEDWTKGLKDSKEYKTVEKYGGETLVVDRQSSEVSTTSIIQRAIGGHLNDTLKVYMQYRKSPLKDK